MFGKLKKYKWWIAGGAAVAGAGYYLREPEEEKSWWGTLALASAGAALYIPAIGIPLALVSGAIASVAAGAPYGLALPLL